MNTKHNGFTIVELLVVIVVIAILATITLVGYNGIRNRAYNTTTIAAADSAIKLISVAVTDHGPIFLDNMSPANATFLCIGDPSNFPANSNFDAGQCHTFDAGGWASQELWDILSQYGNVNSFELHDFYDGTYSHMRGIYYTYDSTKSSPSDVHGYIVYSLIGKNQDCGIAGARKADQMNSFLDGDNETSCWVNMYDRLTADPIDW